MKVLILGATGTIGLQSLEVLALNGITICGIAFNKNVVKANELIHKYKIENVFSNEYKDVFNCSSLQELFDISQPDFVINCIDGFNGLNATFVTLENKKDLALANKESVVMAGKFIFDKAKQNNTKIYPIDSEHTSLMQIMDLVENKDNIDKLYITASGGTYWGYQKKELDKVTFTEASKHPNWNMGWKISIDSSTLMNKCFEIIEAFHYFKTKNVIALYHPQSMIHALIKFNDNSYLASMSKPDMKTSIGLIINKFQDKIRNNTNPIEFDKIINLTLQSINPNEHLPIKWAYEAINNDIYYSIALVAANDAAVKMFMDNKIKFSEIITIIKNTIDKLEYVNIKDLNEIYNYYYMIKMYTMEAKK